MFWNKNTEVNASTSWVDMLSSEWNVRVPGHLAYCRKCCEHVWISTDLRSGDLHPVFRSYSVGSVFLHRMSRVRYFNKRTVSASIVIVSVKGFTYISKTTKRRPFVCAYPSGCEGNFSHRWCSASCAYFGIIFAFCSYNIEYSPGVWQQVLWITRYAF